MEMAKAISTPPARPAGADGSVCLEDISGTDSRIAASHFTSLATTGKPCQIRPVLKENEISYSVLMLERKRLLQSMLQRITSVSDDKMRLGCRSKLWRSLK
jgi:hypothetical protein